LNGAIIKTNREIFYIVQLGRLFIHISERRTASIFKCITMDAVIPFEI